MVEYQERKQSHAEWLDTLTLTEEERKVAGKEAMMDRALEMIERDTITEKNWACFLIFYKMHDERQSTTGETIQVRERLAAEQIEEYNTWVDGLNLGAEERTLLDKLRGLTLERIQNGAELKEEETEIDDGARGVFFVWSRLKRESREGKEASLLASMARKARPYKEWVDALKLTDEEKKIAKGKAVMEKMLDIIVKEATKVKKVNDYYGWRRAMEDQNTEKDRTQGFYYREGKRKYDVWADGLGLSIEERKVLEKMKVPTLDNIHRKVVDITSQLWE